MSLAICRYRRGSMLSVATDVSLSSADAARPGVTVTCTHVHGVTRRSSRPRGCGRREAGGGPAGHCPGSRAVLAGFGDGGYLVPGVAAFLAPGDGADLAGPGVLADHPLADSCQGGGFGEGEQVGAGRAAGSGGVPGCLRAGLGDPQRPSGPDGGEPALTIRYTVSSDVPSMAATSAAVRYCCAVGASWLGAGIRALPRCGRGWRGGSGDVVAGGPAGGVLHDRAVAGEQDLGAAHGAL